MNQKLDFSKELERTVVQSLATSFGLDFLLFEDKKGGDVDTIHNVRAGIYATEQEKQRFENRPDYKETKILADGTSYKVDRYHNDPEFKKVAHQSTERKYTEHVDGYQSGKNLGKDQQLDHVVSTSELHNDAGAYLAEVSPIELSVMKENLVFTQSYVNNKKSNLTMAEFIEKLPEMKANKRVAIQKNQDKLKNMPESTPQERYQKQKVKDAIRKDKEHLENLERCDIDKMRKADQKARNAQQYKINVAYYSSSKFFKQTTVAAARQGIALGLRQALGLVMAETWFELKEQIPVISKKHKENFYIGEFLRDVGLTLSNIWDRIKSRFSDLLANFKDGLISGVFSSITTTLLNIFLTTEKMIAKICREMWNTVVGVIKLIFFNPDNLSAKEIFLACLNMLAGAIAVVTGSLITAYLAPIFTFPFGDAFAAFIGTLVTGLMTLAFGYYISNSDITRKIWEFLAKFQSPYELQVKEIQRINTELDRYLIELTKLKFNMDIEQLQIFMDSLSKADTEFEKSHILAEECKRRNIQLPFELGNMDSTRNWLENID
ncbi:hypothetical protein [Actinobacillus delphinicola]|uniref:Uncharacterized protein n=1 Tax=Actinobacillus delphinicola TaxID=51161 RepID=A0A448TS40_9PAST|nr:hypothetical protein [Actinobacillus delphinicola]VEJ08847.1 Uncharacterised protein [Actinobacillus delphinicola]